MQAERSEDPVVELLAQHPLRDPLDDSLQYTEVRVAVLESLTWSEPLGTDEPEFEDVVEAVGDEVSIEVAEQRRVVFEVEHPAAHAQQVLDCEGGVARRCELG